MQKTHVNTRHAQDFLPDNKTISTFLATQLQRDWFHLYANSPDADRRSMIGHVAENIEDALDWIDRQQSKGRNIYFALNTPRRTQTKKAAKDELRELWGYHIDWDLPKDVERDSREAEDLIDDAIGRLANDARLPGNPCIVFSGNGVQAYWFFARPERATDANQGELETINKRLAQHFKAPAGTHNSERILRVPGTWNFPNESKRKRGCAPVLATLEERASRDFEPGDFKGLPKVDPVTIRATAKRQDFTKAAWIDWQPYDWRDLLKAMPDLPGRLQETLDGQGEHDRSRALYRLIHACLDFLVIEDGHRTVEEMLDDRDIKKQIAELCWQGADEHDTVAEIMGHIVDHEYGPAQLGYDITRVMNAAADEGKAPTPRLVNRVERQAEVFHINTAEDNAVSVIQATKAFIDWVATCTPKKELPNKVEAMNAPAIRQPSTAANVRETLANARITPRWNAMKDEIRFVVDQDAGLQGARPARPAFMFARATSHAGHAERSSSEIDLVLDALTEVGMSDRRMLEGFLTEQAKENRYHPLEDYCTQVPWDGVDRYGQVARCLDANAWMAETAMRVFFRSAVAAVKSLRHFVATGDGLQIRLTVVLVGRQTIGKSTFWARMTPFGFASHGTTLQLGQSRENDSMGACLSGVVCPLNEIATSMRRSDLEALKDFQSRTVDSFRPVYARRHVVKPRMTVFVGTANEDFLLQDQTGSSRYLVVSVEDIDRDLVNELARPEMLQQLYAQAWHEVMEQGLPWWLTGDEEDEQARINEVYRTQTEEEAAFIRYTNSLTGQEVERWLTMNAIFELMGLRYSAGKAGQMKRLLEDAGHRYEADIMRNKKRLRRVFSFPVLPERADSLEAGVR